MKYYQVMEDDNKKQIWILDGIIVDTPTAKDTITLFNDKFLRTVLKLKDHQFISNYTICDYTGESIVTLNIRSTENFSQQETQLVIKGIQ